MNRRGRRTRNRNYLRAIFAAASKIKARAPIIPQAMEDDRQGTGFELVTGWGFDTCGFVLDQLSMSIGGASSWKYSTSLLEKRYPASYEPRSNWLSAVRDTRARLANSRWEMPRRARAAFVASGVILGSGTSASC